MTHGDKNKGADPSLTDTGMQQIESVPLPFLIAQIICGTGQRFRQTVEILSRRIIGPFATKFSPLCGSPDCSEKSEIGFQITLADGSIVPNEDYIGLIGAPGVDLRAWIRSLPNYTLLVAGCELTGALGYKEGKLGCLYRYDGATVTLME